MNIIIQQYKLFNNDNLLIDYITVNRIMVYDKISDPSLLLNCVAINYMDLEFRFDEYNYRIPYLNNKKIIAIKIKSKNIYNYISSNSLINDSSVIYGEKIQSIADVVIGNFNSLIFNPNNSYYSKQLKTIQELNNLIDYNIIFVFTHDLEDFYLKFENQIQDKIILSHNSDHQITYIKNVKLHLAQNCLIQTPKLISLPIGIENHQWFDHNIFYKIKKIKIKKIKSIYFFFNLNTHPSRKICYNKLKDKLLWNKNLDRESYYKELASHKYAICPRGNGLDTHRLWECLYLNVIPIIIENDDLKIYNLPIIILKDWDDLDINNINNSFTNQQNDKLCFEYYINLMR